MALSTVKCNYLTPLHFKGLKYLWQAVTCCAVLLWVTVCWFQSAVALPVLYTGLCTDMQQQHATAVFMVNRFFMQLFRTSNIEIVHYCLTVFGCELPSVLLVNQVWEIHQEICMWPCLVKLFYFSVLLLLSTHADRHVVDISFTVCFFVYVCVCVRRIFCKRYLGRGLA